MMHLLFSHSKIGSIYFVFLSSSQGLLYLGLSVRKAISIPMRLFEQRNDVMLRHDDYAHKPLVQEIRAYLAGGLRCFTIPLDIRGTKFQTAVWDAIRNIPYGETRSYCEIAETIGKSTAARAVGQAAGANPLPIIIPCHRVTGSKGKLGGFSSGLDLKGRLLGLERTYK